MAALFLGEGAERADGGDLVPGLIACRPPWRRSSGFPSHTRVRDALNLEVLNLATPAADRHIGWMCVIPGRWRLTWRSKLKLKIGQTEPSGSVARGRTVRQS